MSGLTNEGLIIVLVLTSITLIACHYFVLARATRIVREAQSTTDIVSLVVFVLVLFMYTIACTIAMFAGGVDSESMGNGIVLTAEIVWVVSPVVSVLSVYFVTKNAVALEKAFFIFPRSREQIRLCIKRSFMFGIPLCAFFAGGDQIVRQLLSLAITGDPRKPVPIDENFLHQLGAVFGYTGNSGIVAYIIGMASIFTIGPFVDLFAPARDSIFAWNDAAATGIGIYFIAAIPEEIGWLGSLYPMLLKYFGRSSSPTGGKYVILKAMTGVGLVWGFWHAPFIFLRWDPTVDSVSAFLFNILFVLSAVACRFVLTSLIWPAKWVEPEEIDRRGNSPPPSTATANSRNLLFDASTMSRAAIERSAGIVRPSLFPAIFAHAAMNVWWNFFTKMYVWTASPGWSLLAGSEFSAMAVLWQVGIALLVVRGVALKTSVVSAAPTGRSEESTNF